MSDDWKAELDSAIDKASAVLRDKQDNLEQRIKEQNKAEAEFEKEIERRRVEADKDIEQQRTSVERQRHELDEEKCAMQDVHKFQSSQIKLDVGGKHFTTSLSTLTREQDSMLAVMFSGRYELTPNSKGAYFIDRDGTHFRYVLNFLRDGEVYLPIDHGVLVELLREADYYQLSRLSKAIERFLNAPKVSKKMANQLLGLTHTNSVCYCSDGTHPTQFTASLAQMGLASFNRRLISDVWFSNICFNGTCSFRSSFLRNVHFFQCCFRSTLDFTGAELCDVSFQCCCGIAPERFIFTGVKRTRVHFDPGVAEKLVFT